MILTKIGKNRHNVNTFFFFDLSFSLSFELNFVNFRRLFSSYYEFQFLFAFSVRSFQIMTFFYSVFVLSKFFATQNQTQELEGNKTYMKFTHNSLLWDRRIFTSINATCEYHSVIKIRFKTSKMVTGHFSHISYSHKHTHFANIGISVTNTSEFDMFFTHIFGVNILFGWCKMNEWFIYLKKRRRELK